MKIQTSAILSSLLATAHCWDYWFIPPGKTDSFCDGITRPDWDECEKKYLEWFDSKDITVGPKFLDGPVFTGERCQIRWIQCSGSGQVFTQKDELGMFGLLRNQCKEDGAGGTQRQGDLCIVVEDPKNPFKAKADPKNKRMASEATAAAVGEKVKPRTHARDLRAETSTLDRRGSCNNDDDCVVYKQSHFSANIRGIAEKVCENVIQDKGLCTKTRAVTVEDSYTAGVDMSVGITKAVTIGGSFTKGHSESVTETLGTTLPIDCPGRSGYIVWYPFLEKSSGQCLVGAQCIAGQCSGGTYTSCGGSKAVEPGDGVLSGEYDSQCI